MKVVNGGGSGENLDHEKSVWKKKKIPLESGHAGEAKIWGKDVWATAVCRGKIYEKQKGGRGGGDKIGVFSTCRIGGQ